MMPDVVRTANKDYKMGIQKITSVNTVCEIFSVCKFPKNNLVILHCYQQQTDELDLLRIAVDLLQETLEDNSLPSFFLAIFN